MERERRGRKRTVLGTTSAKSSKVILPARLPLMEMSKKTRGLDIAGKREVGGGKGSVEEDCGAEDDGRV